MAINTKYRYVKKNPRSKHSEMGTVRQNPIQRPAKLFKKLYNYIMLHNKKTYYITKQFC